jgi:gliding motility-associated-like protein
MKFKLISLIFLISSRIFAQPVLTCSAGNDAYICPNAVAQLTATVNGGTPPYSISWEPAGFCTNPSNTTTTVNIPSSTNFTLTVIDAAQDTCIDFLSVFVNDINKFGAGEDKGICYLFGSPVTIGDPDNYQGNFTFSWLPVSDLSNPSAPNPIATPSVNTTFTLTVSSPSCGTISDEVTVFVYEVNADAGPSITIDEGETATLNGSGGVSYYWSPPQSIKYSNTQNPDVNPISSITYTLEVLDVHGCRGYDTIRVFVRESDELIFYNTFTPNNDGENDRWVIPNISKYPENILEIYNRYGQLVFKRNGYNNEWNGTYFGQELPTGTYFYMLDTNSDKGTYKGSVTIMR